MAADRPGWCRGDAGRRAVAGRAAPPCGPAAPPPPRLHHRTPNPPHTIPVEKTLRNQGAPTSDLLTIIDETLRRLATTLTTSHQPLPPLLAVAATPTGIRLHLATDTDLPEPWQHADTATVWSLTLDAVPTGLEPLEPDGPAPWPHLATVGADDTGRWWLINLETAGITTIGGDPAYADDLARYLAAELATTPWSRDIQVDLIDTFPELAGLDPTRLRHPPDPGRDRRHDRRRRRDHRPGSTSSTPTTCPPPAPPGPGTNCGAAESCSPPGGPATSPSWPG